MPMQLYAYINISIHASIHKIARGKLNQQG